VVVFCVLIFVGVFLFCGSPPPPPPFLKSSSRTIFPDLFIFCCEGISHFSQFVSVFSTFKLFVPINGELINAGSRINFWTFSQTHISKSELKSAHISRFCTVFQVNQVISSAKFSSAEAVDLSFNS